jgi:hypothetical protein
VYRIEFWLLEVQMVRVVLACAVFFLIGHTTQAEEVDYLRDVKPLLQTKCFSCHGAIRQKAGLRLDAAQLLLKGTKNGPVVIPGKPDDSPLIAVITSEGHERAAMPPEGEGEPFSPAQVAMIRQWIKAGAKAPEEPIPSDPKLHWAFQPPKKEKVPGAGHPIDAFLASARAARGISTNPEADRMTLLRRVYLDLIGVPPRADELQAFMSDHSPEAYEKVVDRLLASPHYGERWGRHWMDIWRYSDPFGNGEEYRYSQRHIWRWRDWIVESLNQDKGYDQMIREMLAGDELAPADPNVLRATGYLARNWYKFNRNIWIQDAVEYTAAGFLGITLRCARCHDHKYDPISQLDYYRFRAFFEPHDVRIDPVPGQPDLNKDGVARVYDKTAEQPTYVLIRGDERHPDKSRAIAPALPRIFNTDLIVKPIVHQPRDFAARLATVAAETRKLAQQQLAAAEAAARTATVAKEQAKRRFDDCLAGLESPKLRLTPLIRDQFKVHDQKLWKVLSGEWTWDNGRLQCQKPSHFATVVATIQHPSALMGRIRYITTGGGIGSVGISFDRHERSFQGVYINAGTNPAVRPMHRIEGVDHYPQNGVVPVQVKFNDPITLDFAIRDQLLNVWVNGKLACVYTLPVARHAGGFSIWAHDATVDFTEVILAELPKTFTLASQSSQQLESPLRSFGPLTQADAENDFFQAHQAELIAHARLETARAEMAAVDAREAADSARLTDQPDQARLRLLSRAAHQAECRVRVLQAAERTSLARLALVWVDSQEGESYTPLVKMDITGSTGRRLALANWIASSDNPLTARVAVNHIWMRHFGTPLVPTVANLGLSGKPATHPELLDWLAVEFMQSKWSMKHLHRLIVTSAAYRLSSRNTAGSNQALDPENRYYWRANGRRMDAEVVRDSLLQVAGLLDTTMGGPAIDEKLGLTSRRRSLYFRFNAEYKMTFLDQFDAASPTECFERTQSVVPQQALVLYNSVLALNASRELAKKLKTIRDPAAFITVAFEWILGRTPTAEESARCLQFLKDQELLYAGPTRLTPFPPGPTEVVSPAADPAQRAREDLVHVLFNHNDFVTIR